MADIDDLYPKSLTDMSTDEQLELIRQIRLGRRIPVKPTKQKAIAKKKAAKKPPVVTANQAAELLKILGGK